MSRTQGVPRKQSLHNLNANEDPTILAANSIVNGVFAKAPLATPFAGVLAIP